MVQSIDNAGARAWTTAERSNPFPRAPGITMGGAYNAPVSTRTPNPIQRFAHFVDKETHLSEKVASAKTKFTEWKQERAEDARQEKCRRLDDADAKACGGKSRQPLLGSDKEVIKGFKGGREAISNNLAKWMGDIDTHARTSNVDVAAARTELLQATLMKATAQNLAEVDTESLKSATAKFEREGRTEKAAVLREFTGMVEMSRTPEGASQLFMKEAKLHVSSDTTDGETFLRGTANPGTAAVRKLMNANGAGAYAGAVLEAVKDIFQRPDVKALTEELASKNLTHANTNIPPDLGRRVGDLAREVLEVAVTVPVPPGMRNIFATLKAEIIARGDDKVASFSRKLFSDQLVLKGFGATLAVQSPIIRMPSDLINRSANEVLEEGKYSPSMQVELERVRPALTSVLDDFFASNGL